MPTPSRSDAAGILIDLRAPDTLVRHQRAVAEIAAFLAERIEARGVPVDRALVEAAALVHDLDKALPATDPVRRLGHGHAGAAWLRERDLGELAPAVESHPVMRLTDAAGDRWLEHSTLEERVVAYADKRAAQRLGSVEARFGRWRRRHPEHGEGLDAARGRVALLERDVCGAADVDPADMRRLRWTAAAFAAAATARAVHAGQAGQAGRVGRTGPAGRAEDGHTGRVSR